MILRSIRSAAAVALTATVLFALGTITSTAAQAACPDNGYTNTPGERVMGPNNATVYLTDPAGYLRPIVGADTYNYFFRSWAGIKVRSDIACIKKSSLSLSYPTSALAHDGRGSYYFVEPYGTTVRYRGIPSVAVYDKYLFRWDTPAYTDPSWIATHLGATWS